MLSKSRIQIDRNDLRTLLICALRYALGRKTYMPKLVQDLCKEHHTVLCKDDCTSFAREIDNHYKMFGNIGMDFDTQDWFQFKNWLLEKAASPETSDD